MPMQKSSTRLNSEEVLKTKENTANKLKAEIVNSILNFSKSLEVKNSATISHLEYNLN